MQTTEEPLSQQLVAGSIVLPARDSHWGRYQGLVIDPNSDAEGEGFRVAVFFNLEADRYEFAHYQRHDAAKGILSIAEWDALHRTECLSGDLQFLLKDDGWKKCPRIIYFRPKDLTVSADWVLEGLAKRMFGRNYHTVNYPMKKYPQTATAYMCFSKECLHPATRTVLWNIHGSVFPVYLCKECFPDVSSCCADDLPPIKHPFLSADGVPFQVE